MSDRNWSEGFTSRDMADSTTEAGDANGPSIDESFVEMYAELRRLAHSKLRQNAPLTLLDTTSLVHESYLKLLRAGGITTAARPQFLAYASNVMRSIIVDCVRRRRAERHGGCSPHVQVEVVEEPAAEEEIVRVNDALNELEKVDARLVKVVEMRYFGGLSEPEISESLGITDRTVRRDWKRARLLLSLALK
jgi:RNA polymerase sigma factor (TIGR02999 family)